MDSSLLPSASHMPRSASKKNTQPPEIISLHIDAIAFEGKSIARDEHGMVWFVEGGIPGDTIAARVIKRKKQFGEARLQEVLVSSPHRVAAPCNYFGDCGGCKWQNFDYAHQLHWKHKHTEDAFVRLGKINVGTIYDTIGAEQKYHYRNKMEFSFGTSRWLTAGQLAQNEVFRRDFALGLHVPGRFDKVIDIEQCFLQPPMCDQYVNIIRTQAKELGLSIFETRHHTGFLRNLVIRTSSATGEIMLIVVTSAYSLDVEQAKQEHRFIEWVGTEFAKHHSHISTIVHAVNRTKSTVAIGEPKILTGAGTITEHLLGVAYQISPFSFFQTNTQQAETLFRVALDYAELTSDKVVWDLYCGTGSITLATAQRAKYVVGIELVESSILDARANAVRNGIANVEFHSADMHAASVHLFHTLPKPDVIIIDPPRAGMHPKVVEHLAGLAVETLVYVSCNPATQARDCALLDHVYAVEKVQPVDMFPHTYHIESVALLRKR